MIETIRQLQLNEGVLYTQQGYMVIRIHDLHITRRVEHLQMYGDITDHVVPIGDPVVELAGRLISCDSLEMSVKYSSLKPVVTEVVDPGEVVVIFDD